MPLPLLRRSCLALLALPLTLIACQSINRLAQRAGLSNTAEASAPVAAPGKPASGSRTNRAAQAKPGPVSRPTPLPPRASNLPVPATPLLLTQPAAQLQAPAGLEAAPVGPNRTPNLPVSILPPGSAAASSATLTATAPISEPISAPVSAPISAPILPAAPPAALPPIPAPPGESAAPPPGFILPADLFGKPQDKPQDKPQSKPDNKEQDVKANATPTAKPEATPAIKPEAKTDATPNAIAKTAPAPDNKPENKPENKPPATPATPATLVKPLATTAPDITQKLVPTKLPPVYLYQSPSTRTFLAAGGVNYQNNIDIWHLLLKRLDIPFERIDQIERLNANGAERGLVLLPSAVALSETERRTLARFHERGGAILASWLCGVRNEQGQWLGFNFMENVLDTRVVGTTEAEQDDTFLIPYGDSPISHQLPSGLRVWTERIPNWYPLRLSGQNLAARIMDWSRSTTPDKTSGLISYNQRQAAAGGGRSVVFGYPERLWFSADPKAFDALAGDAIFWLLRQPAVYPASWPHPYRSAFVLTIGAADFSEAADLAFAKQTAAANWRASYYVLTERSDEHREVLKKIQQIGHDIGYFGDRLVGFQNQSANQQKKRIDTMLAELRESGAEPASPPGFKAPLDAFDATTLRLLRAKGFGHVIADQGASETRLPQWASGSGEPLALLPRTISAPEDLMGDQPPANAIRAFLHEVDVADAMGALGMVSLPSHGSLSGEQWGQILDHFKQRGPQLWLASANQVVSWWRERSRVKVSLNNDVTPALLTLEVSGEGPLQQPFGLLVNLPHSTSKPRLIADGHNLAAPKTESFDALRGALVFAGLPPGTWHWYLSFSNP